jgi:WD40 repeat protein
MDWCWCGDIASGEIVQQLGDQLAAVQSVAFSPDGQYALSGAADNTAVLWDLTSGEAVQRLVGHKGDVSGAAFTPDGRYAVTSEDTAAAPSDLIVWDLATGAIVRRFGGEGGRQSGRYFGHGVERRRPFCPGWTV